MVGDLQAIKKVLIENFHEKEEAHPQVILYKNLWLEAEASLCSINCMARFSNMKIEIEKCKLGSEKGLKNFFTLLLDLVLFMIKALEFSAKNP